MAPCRPTGRPAANRYPSLFWLAGVLPARSCRRAGTGSCWRPLGRPGGGRGASPRWLLGAVGSPSETRERASEQPCAIARVPQDRERARQRGRAAAAASGDGGRLGTRARSAGVEAAVTRSTPTAATTTGELIDPGAARPLADTIGTGAAARRSSSRAIRDHERGRPAAGGRTQAECGYPERERRQTLTATGRYAMLQDGRPQPGEGVHRSATAAPSAGFRRYAARPSPVPSRSAGSSSGRRNS